jgi:hypothetical protein
MWMVALFCWLGFLAPGPSLVHAEEASGKPLLLVPEQGRIEAVLPKDTHVLIHTNAIEQFLDELDGEPPDWKTVYGHGRHDPGHDDRLFALNRERDRLREGKPALQQRITFIWPGELSDYEPKVGGFRVAIGPRFHPTRWGIIRFKPEEVPANLIAIPSPTQRHTLQARLKKGEHVEIEVAMTGRLIPEESIMYDFSHDEEGRGLIMPVVRIERIDYLITN